MESRPSAYGDRSDNRIENLEVVSASEHTLLHWNERGRTERCPHGHVFDEENTARNPSGWRYCKQCNRDSRPAKQAEGRDMKGSGRQPQAREGETRMGRASAQANESCRPGTCLGCSKGRIVPGCPLHDPQERQA